MTQQEFAQYRDLLKTNVRRPRVKVEFLREDETPYFQVTHLLESSGGSLSIQKQNGLRRSVDLTLINVDNYFVPNPDSFWIGQKFKLYLGFEDEGQQTFWFQQGVFVIENPSVTSSPEGSTISIHGLDKFCLLDGTLGGELNSGLLLEAEDPAVTAIEQLMLLSLDPTPHLIILEDLQDEILPYEIYKEMGEVTIGEILQEIAQIYSCSVYYNEYGYLVFDKDEADELLEVLWDFSDDEYNYLGGSRSFLWSEVFNSVMVIGDSILGETFFYTAKNEDLLSPTSIPNLGYERIKIIKRELLDTVAKCKELAEYYLKYLTAVQDSVDISCIPMYHLNPDAAITLKDSKLGLQKERYTILGITIPFEVGSSASINCVRSTTLTKLADMGV